MTAFTLNAEAAASIGRRKYDPPAAVACGLNRKPTRVISGATSLSNSTHFPVIEDSKFVNPVTFPPGWAKLATKPSPIGGAASLQRARPFPVHNFYLTRFTCVNAPAHNHGAQ